MSPEPPINPSADPRSSEELIALAISLAPEMDDAISPSLHVLQYRLREISAEIIALAHSADPRLQEVAAIVLGQNRIGNKVLENKCAAELLRILGQAHDEYLLTATIYALAHVDAPERATALLPFVEHPSARVRNAVGYGLGRFDNDTSIAALITLSRDTDYDVRNWATFGFGNLTDRDTPEIRDALAARIDDEGEVHLEALYGLTVRRDARAIAPLLKHLNDSTDRSLISLVWDCVDKLRESREEFGPEWTPVFEILDTKFSWHTGLDCVEYSSE